MKGWLQRRSGWQLKDLAKTKLKFRHPKKHEENEGGKSPNKVKDEAIRAWRDDQANGGGKSQKNVKIVAKRTWKDEPEEGIPEIPVQVQPLSQKQKVAHGSQATFEGSTAMKRAIKIQASLPSQFPSTVKGMLKSHVSGGFWLGLEISFCAKHLPKEKETEMTLEDEDGHCSEAKYLSSKAGLSGGWRGFSIAHKLSVGDVIVFQLVNPRRFKVYISRASREDAMAASLNLPKLNVSRKRTLVGKKRLAKMETEDLDSELPSGYSSQENNSTDDDSYKWSDTDTSEDDNVDFAFNIGDGIRGYGLNDVDFSEVRSFAHFDIIADGWVIDPELCKDLRLEYYKLCFSRNCFLHQHLIPGLNVKTIAGLIADTVNVANNIRDSKSTTSVDEFAKWKAILQGLQGFGMDVGFLIKLLDQLMGLADRSRRLEDAKAERSRALEELSRHEAKILETRERLRKLDEDSKTLEAGGPKLEIMFQVKAKTPW